VGTIRLRATAKVPATSAGPHQVSFLNTHRPESSVYLVNALVPENPRIQLADQRRDVAQHGLTLDYTVTAGAPSPSDRTFALLAGLAMLGCLFLRHGRGLGSPNLAGQRPLLSKLAPTTRLGYCRDWTYWRCPVILQTRLG